MSDIRMRTAVEPQWPAGGYTFSRQLDRHYDVQQYTGYPSSTVQQGQWDRGMVYRYRTPQLRLPRENRVYDPTDPRTWPTNYR